MEFNTPFEVNTLTLIDRLRKGGTPEGEEAAIVLEQLAAYTVYAVNQLVISNLKEMDEKNKPGFPNAVAFAFLIGCLIEKLEEKAKIVTGKTLDAREMIRIAAAILGDKEASKI